jgi:secreted Zn-dependent insulinase-like peptidase
MNDKQLEQAKKALREEMNAHGYGWINGNYIKPPKKYYLRDREFWCIEMINSILAYQGAGMTDAEQVMQMEERSYYNYLAEYVEMFDREKVVALIQGQIDSIDRVKHCVHTDSEGVTYNSIVWKEEEQ